MAEPSHTLTIVIPVLNEEDAVGSTIERCLEARAHIIDSCGVDGVEVIVVSDGSTDRSEEIAVGFDEVKVLVFERNRGYGAAIKCGWEHGRGDYLAFLDGDGTCDPRFFADLCRALEDQQADIALGSRMGPGSEMPPIRRFGNTLFKWLLGALTRQPVKDTASGMRVVRRDCLEQIYPLPDGLHFTPAMSARVLLRDNLKLVELPMPYQERVGRSKLSVLRDGLRFLGVILRAAVTYRPARLLLFVSSCLAAGVAVVGSGPLLHWLREGRLDEWEIYRILMASLLATMSATFVCGAVVSDRIAAAAQGREPDRRGLTGAVSRLFTPRMRLFGGGGLLLAGLLVVSPGIVEFVTTGTVEMHWSRAMLGSLFVVMATILAVTTFLLNMLNLIDADGRVSLRHHPPDRIHAPSAGDPGIE